VGRKGWGVHRTLTGPHGTTQIVIDLGASGRTHRPKLGIQETPVR
jgi:hypothetical protein